MAYVISSKACVMVADVELSAFTDYVCHFSALSSPKPDSALSSLVVESSA